MKRILCYGDSNTWGADPASPERFGIETRWTRVLANALGSGYEIIEEGLPGRTTVWDDPIEGYKNGRDYLIPCLESHRPLDGVVLMLGTNDLKQRFGLSAFDVAEGAKVLVGLIQSSAAGHSDAAPPVLLLAPPPLAPLTGYAEMFAGGEAKSLKFGQYFARVAAETGYRFFDTAGVIRSSPIDGIHWEASEHAKLGRALAAKVAEL